MKGSASHPLLPAVLISLALAALSTFVHAQTQAVNGEIEGIVLDQNGAVIFDAVVIATNLGTGTNRTLATNGSGTYRFPLLPLGAYRITAHAPGFKRFVHERVTVSTDEPATVDIIFQVGEINDTTTVSLDTSVADAGKTDLGRVMNFREVQSVPLPTRNPYNFIFLQANVTGRPSRGFNYPQANVNGLARRVNYMLDGSTNTRGDIAGARLMLIPESYVNEIQLVTNSFAPEFGNTTGMIMNVVTPSGENDLSGSVQYVFRLPSFYARPFFFSDAKLPSNYTSNLAGKISGPIIKDRWHFYFGYEGLRREDNTRGNRQVTISEADKADLIAAGLPASIFVSALPSHEEGSHYFFRTDAQLGGSRLMIRFNHAAVNFGAATGNSFDTLDRVVDTRGIDNSLGLQLFSFKSEIQNEFRFQHARSKTSNARNENSGTGPSIAITNVANFGSPTNADTVSPFTRGTEAQDNITLTRDSHSIKFGGGLLFSNSTSRSAVFSLFTFPSVASYVAARNGGDPLGYTKYEEFFGNPEISHRSTYWNFFVQDDWKVTQRLKFNYGIRYDLYVVPKADPSSLFPSSRKFNVDKNNFAPRLGLVFAIREGSRPLVLRAGAGIYYEPPWMGMYTRALRENGNPDFFSIGFLGSNGGDRKPGRLGPAFPNTFSGSQPPGSALPQQDIVAIAPDFENMYAIHSHIQLEQALTEDLSLAVGFVHSGGRHIPVYRSINRINPISFLADGRPVFGTSRLDPRFNLIQMAESAGVSQYDALTLQLTQRFSRGIQFAAIYTLSKAVDDAPEQEVTYSDGLRLKRALSDPTNRSLDKGYSYGDQRHTFVMSLVADPRINVPNRVLRYLANHNRFAIIARANSGERFSPRVAGNIDLNGDDLAWPDRPVGIKRNSGKTPPQFNLDLRYSRSFAFGERYRLEAFAEFQNLFNINCIVQYNDVSVPTNIQTGELIGELPDFRAKNKSIAQESRQLQIGFRFTF